VTDPVPKILHPAEPFIEMDRVVIPGDVGKPDHILFRGGRFSQRELSSLILTFEVLEDFIVKG
jgi:hypothetical protein